MPPAVHRWRGPVPARLVEQTREDWQQERLGLARPGPRGDHNVALRDRLGGRSNERLGLVVAQRKARVGGEDDCGELLRHLGGKTDLGAGLRDCGPRLVGQHGLDKWLGEHDAVLDEQRSALIPQTPVAQPIGGVVVAQVRIADGVLEGERGGVRH